MNFQPPDNPEMTPDDLQAEIYRLNKWADEFSNAQIKERQTGEMYQRELRITIEQQAAKIAELESSEKEGWRYADELEHERKRLEAIIAEWDKRCEAGYNKLDWLDAVERVAELEELGNSSLDLLCLMYSLWEEGQPCYEDYDEKINDGLFIGNAFKLDEGVENKIIAMLNKHRPVVHNLT